MLNQGFKDLAVMAGSHGAVLLSVPDLLEANCVGELNKSSQ